MKAIPFRAKYFLSHLLISLTVAALSLFLIFGLWYPAPLHKALGVSELVIMILTIDVVLGPLLTLILAKEGKKGLKTDLILIGTVQLAALFYGLYTVDKGRPVAIAFDINRFEAVAKHTIKGDHNKQIIQQFADNQDTAIPAVAIRPAKDEQEYITRMENEMEKNILSSSNPELYQTLAESMDIIKQTMKPIDQLPKLNANAASQIMTQYPTADGYLPLAGSAKTMTVLLDTKNNTIVGIVEANPW